MSWVFGGVAGLGWLTMAFGGVGMAMFSVMLFDAPGSEDNPYLYVVLYSILSLPLLALFSAACTPTAVLISRLLFRRGRATGGWLAMAVAVLVACLPLLSFVGIATGFVLIDVMCDGSFSC